MSALVHIYALCEPDTLAVRYVGKAIDPVARLKNHRNEKRETRKCRWLASLARRGLQPILVTLEWVTGDQWQEAERRWIARYRAEGADLCNHTDGGEGLTNADAETRQRVSAVRRALWADPEKRASLEAAIQSPDRRARISAALTGKRKSPEHVAKLPQNRAGRKLTDAQRARISAALQGNQYAKGLRHTAETRVTISTKLRGNRATLGREMPEHEKAQRSLALKDRPKPTEWRERIRQGQLRAWERRKAQEVANGGVLAGA